MPLNRKVRIHVLEAYHPSKLTYLRIKSILFSVFLLKHIFLF
jgi:hypothetical protein